MICRLARSLLPLHAGSDLPGPVERLVAGHVAGCAACGAEVHALRAMRRTLAGAGRDRGEPGDLGDNFWHEIRRDLRSNGLVGERAAESAPARRRERERETARALAIRGLAAAAAVLVAALLFFPEVGKGPAGVTPPEREIASSRPRPLPAPAVPVVQIAAERRPWIEETASFAPPGTGFELEGWQSHDPAVERLVRERKPQVPDDF